jgi:putative transposase
MPNHVHFVMKPSRPLPEVMLWLKTAAANRANRLLGTTGGAFWQREYYDRWIRSDEQLAYVEVNPIRSGLAAYPEEWRWSSARKAPVAKTAGATGWTVAALEEM